jgi:hypothetical protein
MTDLLDVKMKKLWILMTEMYGHRWTSSMGETPNETWTAACKVFGDQEWRNAVNMAKQSTDDWPPSLPTFRRWAYLGMTPVEAKELCARKADALVGAVVGKYNPNCAGPTYDQVDRMHDRISRSLYVDTLDRERNAAMGIEHSERDPLRICPDEDYR